MPPSDNAPHARRTAGLAARRGGAVDPPGRSFGTDVVIPRATYRVQLHKGFTFDDARRIVPYLASLGISHLYTSPFLDARAGSTHGYDVVDHEALNPEIGTEADFDALTATLREHGMRLMLDLVPNHMGVLKADNAWWLDVLEHGQASRYAGYFDIDWAPPDDTLQGRVLVPILGDQYGTVLERGEIALRFAPEQGALSLWYYEHRLPVRPAEYPRILLANLRRVPAGVANAIRRVARRFAAVPMQQETTRDATALGAAAKAVLAELCASTPAAARLVEENAAAINGKAGDPRSFDALDALLGAQAYRLAFWRVAADDINYRRFFDINDLAGLRAEREDVFAATHRRVLAIVAQGRADCLRIDHPDGLSDPARYFERLQAAAAEALRNTPDDRGRAAYVVVEKILAAHERLPDTWPVHGDTGYSFMREVNARFVDPRAQLRFDRLYAGFIGRPMDLDDVLRRAKTHVVVQSLASDLNRLATKLTRIVKRDRRTRDFSWNAIRRALVEVVAALPVYRTYVTETMRSREDQRYVDWAIAVAKRHSAAADTSVLDFIGAVLRGDYAAGTDDVVRFVMRFQQWSAPAMAKGLEDTSFYVFNRLVSLNEVGGDARLFGATVGAFHRACRQRASRWQHSLLATSTHDNKRSEDVRARIDVLSEVPAQWRTAVRRWRQFNRRHRSEVDGEDAPSRNDEYLFYQTVVGAWPLGKATQRSLDALRARIQAYMKKAVREAKVSTSWVNVNAEYEAALERFVGGALGQLAGNPFLADLVPFAQRIAFAGCVNSLAQTTLKLTSPGVPDTYQGTEVWDFSLVDPDNRRPVDYAARETLLRKVQRRAAAQLLDTWQDGGVKLLVTARLLALRKRRATWFERATYRAVRVRGAHRNSVCAFMRSAGGSHLLCVVPRLWQAIQPAEATWPLGDAVWGDTSLSLDVPVAQWRNVITDEVQRPLVERAGARLPVGAALATFPVAVFEEV
jgi:(1->4)-alpha-D-glucan 1-alpha-D-glucosylmutase